MGGLQSDRTPSGDRSRRTFVRVWASTGDYRQACRAAGISERTGRRWRAELEKKRFRSADEWLPYIAPTRFFGRADALELISDHFASSVRLCTVIGPPGMGKTRLVSEWLRAKGLEFSGDDVPIFCDLRRVESDAGFAVAVAAELGVQLQVSGSRAGPSLGRVLRARGSSLLVLDNIEQIASVAAPMLACWLRMAPGLRILATSRCVLGLSAETVVELGPLDLPERTNRPNPDSDHESDAVRLLRSRLEAQRRFAGEMEPAVLDAIVRRLEGVPLAIELAAAQLQHRSAAALLSELDSTVLHLEDGRPDAETEHSSLFSAIERSWRLLDPHDRRILAMLSVFRHGFTTEAAAAVVTGSLEDDLEPRLYALRDACLLRLAESESGSRWDLYEAIREFATERAKELGLAESTRLSHATFFAALSQSWLDGLDGPHSERALDSLRAEIENLRGAFEHLRKNLSKDPEPLFNLAEVLWAALAESLPRVAEDILTAALDRTTDAPGSDLVRARMLVRRATCLRETGQMDEARRDLTQAENCASRANQQDAASQKLLAQLSAELRFESGRYYLYQGNGEAARTQLRAALAEAAKAGLVRLEGQAHMVLAWVLAEIFRDPVAFEHHPRAVECMTHLDRRGEAHARWLWSVHKIFFSRGDTEEAIRRWRETATRTRDRYSMATAAMGLSIYHFDRFELDRAESYGRQCCHLAEEIGLRRYRAVAVLNVAMILDVRGEFSDLKEASCLYGEAVRSFRDQGDKRFEALACLHLAGARARTDDWEEAQYLLSRATSLLRGTGDETYEELVRLQNTHLHIAGARRELGRGGNWDAELRLAWRRLSSARTLDRRTNTSLLESSMEARNLTVILERELARFERNHNVLRVAEDASWFSLRASSTRSLPEGAVLRRVFKVLLNERLSQPGTPLHVPTLLERAWPGERILADAGVRRVRDVIIRLRRAGLNEVIRTGNEGGYFVDAELRVILDGSKPPSIPHLSP